MAKSKSTSAKQNSSTIPLDQSYATSTAPYSPWSGLSGLSNPLNNNNNLTIGGAQSPAVPYQQSMFTDKFNFNTPGYGQMAAYGPPAPTPAITGVGGTGAAVTSGAAQSPWSFGGGDLLSDAWNKAGDFGNGITDSMKGFSEWGQKTGLLGGTKMVDGKEVKTDGWGGLALGAANGVFNAYNSLATLNATKDMLETQKHFASANLQNGQKSYNTQIENRQRDRVAANPNEMSVSDYMAKHRLG